MSALSHNGVVLFSFASPRGQSVEVWSYDPTNEYLDHIQTIPTVGATRTWQVHSGPSNYLLLQSPKEGIAVYAWRGDEYRLVQTLPVGPVGAKVLPLKPDGEVKVLPLDSDGEVEVLPVPFAVCGGSLLLLAKIRHRRAPAELRLFSFSPVSEAFFLVTDNVCKNETGKHRREGTGLSCLEGDDLSLETGTHLAGNGSTISLVVSRVSKPYGITIHIDGKLEEVVDPSFHPLRTLYEKMQSLQREIAELDRQMSESASAILAAASPLGPVKFGESVTFARNVTVRLGVRAGSLAVTGPRLHDGSTAAVPPETRQFVSDLAAFCHFVEEEFERIEGLIENLETERSLELHDDVYDTIDVRDLEVEEIMGENVDELLEDLF
ncbi:unnamed protein product, partial [Darwinula stevensoni]